MNIKFSITDQLRRKVNLIFQTLLVTFLFYKGINEIIPLWLILWQIIHFFLIALADYYLDDYPYKKRSTTSLLFVIYVIFLIFSLYFGVFDELYMRIHGAVIILGNLLGNKVDKPFWKILTFLNLIILVTIELIRDEVRMVLGNAIIYIIVAICLLAITERLSEKNRNFWILHTAVLFFWVIFKGPFYQEAFIFLIGGISYELFKIIMNKIPEQKNTNSLNG